MPQPSVIVRRVSAHDAALARLVALSDEYMADLYPPESNHLEPVAKLAAPNVVVFGAYAGAELVGCVAAKSCEADVSYAEVKRLFVLEDHRGAGLAKLLMSRLEEHLRQSGIFIARLETGVKQPEALRLYERLGYVYRPPFAAYRLDPLSVFMEKRLAT